MPFVRCDNYVPSVRGSSPSDEQPPNNFTRFGNFYSNTSNMPTLQGSPSPSNRPVAPPLPAAVSQKNLEHNNTWFWLVAIVLLVLLVGVALSGGL